MDAALLREREAFKRKAMALPVVENKAKAGKSGSSSKSASDGSKKAAAAEQSAKAKLELAQMKSVGGSSGSQFKFGVLARIVRHMKTRHMDGVDHPLTLDDILDETHQLDVGGKTRAWLQNEALRDNPKISADGHTYLFKPPFAIRNRKGLMRLLRQHDLKGQGAVFLDDVHESLPKAEKVVKALLDDNRIIVLTRPGDKKKVVFFHDHTCDFAVDDEFRKLWRSVAVDSVDDAKIDEYLERQGIRSMQDQGLRRLAPAKKRRNAGRRRHNYPKDNAHLKDVLEDYTDMGDVADKKA